MPAGLDTEHLLDAVAHFGGGLVGEGHRQNAVRRGILDLDQPGNAVHQHAGFTGAGTGQHQLAAHTRGNSLALGIIKRGNQEFGVILHRGILGGCVRQGKPGLLSAGFIGRLVSQLNERRWAMAVTIESWVFVL